MLPYPFTVKHLNHIVSNIPAWQYAHATFIVLHTQKTLLPAKGSKLPQRRPLMTRKELFDPPHTNSSSPLEVNSAKRVGRTPEKAKRIPLSKNNVSAHAEIPRNGPVISKDKIPQNQFMEQDAPFFWQERILRPGLRVSTLEATLPEHFSFTYQKQQTTIDFSFFLEGGVINTLKKTSLGKRTVKNSAGYGGIGFFKEMSGIVTPIAEGKIRSVHLHVCPTLLSDSLAGDMDTVHKEIQTVINGEKHHDFLLHHAIDPIAIAAASELFFSLTLGKHNTLYIEGKALELIGLQVMKPETSFEISKNKLTAREKDKIREISQNLIQHLDSPPNMAKLSQEYSMSINTIQRGFQKLYGMSVFGFLKEYKLDKAKTLFEKGDMNVTEVAFAIGYTNVSHFGAAFKKRYGILPKKYASSIHSKSV